MNQSSIVVPEATGQFRGLEDIAAALERTREFRVLRRLRPHDEFMTPMPDGPTKIGLVVDVETTGLDWRQAEIIELGMLRFEYLPDGRVCRVADMFAALNEPAVAVSPEITGLTGITNEMLLGRKIDDAAVARFASDAAIVFAHNAAFDRKFVECRWPLFEHLPWACSSTQIDWRGLGFDSARLVNLLAGIGLFHDAHRAVDDCRALLEVLAHRRDGRNRPFLGELLDAARRKTSRVWAEHSPFELKDRLKRRGYRWSDGTDGRPKSWYVDVDAALVEAEIRFLREEIYFRHIDPDVQEMTAYDRFSHRV